MGKKASNKHFSAIHVFSSSITWSLKFNIPCKTPSKKVHCYRHRGHPLLYAQGNALWAPQNHQHCPYVPCAQTRFSENVHKRTSYGRRSWCNCCLAISRVISGAPMISCRICVINTPNLYTTNCIGFNSFMSTGVSSPWHVHWAS